MIVGILKEIKAEENRVSMTPGGVELLVEHGHTVLVEKDAGLNSGFDNSIYKEYGAKIVGTAKQIYKRSDMVMHVKEPIPDESIMWGCLWCKDSINCLMPKDWYSDASLDSHINYIVSHINGRPLIFQYWNRHRYDENDYNACMEEVRSIVEEIRKDNGIGFVRKPIQDDKYIEEIEKPSLKYASDGFSVPSSNDLNVVIDILRDLAEHCFEEFESTKSKNDEQKYKLFDRVADFLESMIEF